MLYLKCQILQKCFVVLIVVAVVLYTVVEEFVGLVVFASVVEMC